MPIAILFYYLLACSEHAREDPALSVSDGTLVAVEEGKYLGRAAPLQRTPPTAVIATPVTNEDTVVVLDVHIG